MKLLHISDLHLGKRINEFSLIEDQEYILTEILGIAEIEKPDALVIAGDVYDKSVPSTEAVRLFDDFLFKASGFTDHIFVISGNHDSPERIAFGGRIMDTSGIHLSPVYNGAVSPIYLNDTYGEVRIYMLPFIKPSNVKRFYPEDDTATYEDAVRAAISHMDIDNSTRNILITHQFVSGAERSESEEIFIGGTESVNADVFSQFDYTALGHLHRPQTIGKRIRYSGTPLKYSFSEASHVKSVTVAELLGKSSEPVIREIALTPLKDMREIKGTYMELTARSTYEGTNTDDYIHITLTDEYDIPDAAGRLSAVYKNLMKLDYDNKRTKSIGITEYDSNAENKTPLELLSEFYEKQNAQPMTNKQREFAKALIEDIWEEP